MVIFPCFFRIKTKLRFDEVMDSGYVEIYNSGLVTFAYPLTLTTSCELDVRAFPMDQQVRQLFFLQLQLSAGTFIPEIYRRD